MSGALDKVLREARGQFGARAAKDVDWDAVDKGVFARIEQERRAELARLAAASRRSRVWTGAAVGLAAAAAFAIVAGRTRETRSLDVPAPHVAEAAVVGSIASIDGAGEVLVAGRAAAVGTVLRAGDSIEVRGVAQATIDRPGKLTFVVESGSRAVVERGGAALVLALERGTVEAQVVPVASGEAFAVDVGASRVAVHGTHLRVARVREQSVVVDLSEGVVSIGEAPRAGATFGVLVTAPAHAEFEAADARGTLSVSHDSSSVRAPLTIAAVERSAGVSPPPSAAAAAAPTADAVPAPAPLHAPRPSAPPPPAAELSSESSVARAVYACLAKHAPAENVSVEFHATLTLGLADDGTVTSAVFNPPVAPDVNACAVQSIHKARFAHGGSVGIPLDFKISASAP